MENEQTIRRWKEFDLSPPHTRTGDYASINQKGVIVLNDRLWEKLGKPTAVSLLFDEDNLTIGIRSVSPVMPNAFPVVKYRGLSTYWIRAQHFTTAARLDISYCVRFTDPKMEGDVLILDLNLTTRVHGSRIRTAKRNDIDQ